MAGMQNTEGGAAQNSPRKNTSLSAAAYFAIRDMLVTTRIQPGAPVHEEELTRQLGVGRTPVREAIKRLESERLVKVYPRRGVFATEVQLSDLSLLTEVRAPLEGEAAYQTARRATGQQRCRLAGLRDEAFEHGRDAESQMVFDSKVHRAIYECSHNTYLEATLTQYYNLMLRIWYLYIDRLPAVTDHVGELVPLLETMIDCEADRARELAVEHIRGFEKAVLSIL
ncbi:GntR family transcriptional regulator [Nocardiopsis halophila]|uniref:GntR family transcriptional regulator n=1 Tax=Nocardiopsis halophila TaxID=141692 RepID=UPI003084335B